MEQATVTDNVEKRFAEARTDYPIILIGLIVIFGISVGYKSPATTAISAAAQPPAPATTAALKGVVVAGKPSTSGTLGCVNLNERALAAGSTGRIFDLSDPDKCVGIPNGTLVVEQKHWQNATCVVPEGASPPCLWVMMSELAYPRDYQPPNTLVERPRLFPSTTPAPTEAAQRSRVWRPLWPSSSSRRSVGLPDLRTRSSSRPR